MENPAFLTNIFYIKSLIKCNSINGIATIVILGKDSMRALCKDWEQLNLDQVSWFAHRGSPFNSTVLSGHSVERGQDRLLALPICHFVKYSHNPVSDVNIGQNGQLPLPVSEWLETSTGYNVNKDLTSIITVLVA